MTEDQSCEEPTLELVSTCSEGKQLTDDKLILKVVANKRYNSWVLKTTMEKVWNPEGLFIFIFENKEARTFILENGY